MAPLSLGGSGQCGTMLYDSSAIVVWAACGEPGNDRDFEREGLAGGPIHVSKHTLSLAIERCACCAYPPRHALDLSLV